MESKEPAQRRAGQKIKLGKDKYKLVVFAGYDAASGKRKYKSETFHGGSKAADGRLTELQHRANTRHLVLKTKTTMNQLLDQWLKVTAASVKARTLETYRVHAESYVRPALGECQISKTDLLGKKIQELYSAYREKGFEAKTIAFLHHIIGSALRLAVKRKLIYENPALDTVRPKIGRKEMRYLKPDEAIRFLQVAKGDEFEAYFILAIDSGMRPAECLGLQWSDLDFKAGTVSVQRKLEYATADDWFFDTLKSARAYRTIHLASSTLQTLAEHKKKQDVVRLKTGPAYAPHNLVFANEVGNARTMTVVREHYKLILGRAELDTRTRLYDARHTSATLLLAAGVDLKTLSERLGHADEGFTLKTYAHVLPGMRAQAAERLEQSVFSRLRNQFATLADNGKVKQA